MRSVTIFLSTVIIFVMASFAPKSKLTVTSTAFSNNGMIPVKYSCKGSEVSPALHISGVPSAAKSLALIVHDPDAPMPGGFTHWVMWNIDVNGNIPEGFKDAMQGMNGAKQTGYKGMCPPSGTHHYLFYAYALDTKLAIDKNTDKAGLEKAMQGHIVAEGELTGLFKHE